MVKWRLKVLEKNDGIVYKLRIERVFDERNKDVWDVECGFGGDVDWIITKTSIENGVEQEVFRMRVQEKFSYAFVQSRCGFEPEDPWFCRKSDLLDSIRSQGVKRTALDIINYFASSWQEYLLPQDLLSQHA